MLPSNMSIPSCYADLLGKTHTFWFYIQSAHYIDDVFALNGIVWEVLLHIIPNGLNSLVMQV